MRAWQIVIDTNVFVSALRSRTGASYRLLSLVGNDRRFDINISVPLILEYEDVAKRDGIMIELSHKEVEVVINYLCSVGKQRQIYFLWRPFLRDSKDDMILELAVEAQCDFIITQNTKDFDGVEQFGLRAITPQAFLRQLGENP